MASRSGIVFLVIFGVAAIAVGGDGCDPDNTTTADAGDTDGDFDLDFDGDDGGGGGSTCDGVVVVEAASGTAQVPGNTSLIGSDDTARCALRKGADGDAVGALQGALARCNGQHVAVDGEFGDQTAQAVMNVQSQHGVAADGVYGPATLSVMAWPLSGGGCGGGVSADSPVIDDVS